jgi:hypothetical protein
LYQQRLETKTTGVLKLPANRDVFVRALAVLCIALVCVMGTVQATHSHPDDSTASHHTCTICASAHAGVSTAPVASVPVLTTTTLAISVAEVSPVFRPVTARFIRPPPAL